MLSFLLYYFPGKFLEKASHWPKVEGHKVVNKKLYLLPVDWPTFLT